VKRPGLLIAYRLPKIYLALLFILRLDKSTSKPQDDQDLNLDITLFILQGEF